MWVAWRPARGAAQICSRHGRVSSFWFSGLQACIGRKAHGGSQARVSSPRVGLGRERRVSVSLEMSSQAQL